MGYEHKILFDRNIAFFSDKKWVQPATQLNAHLCHDSCPVS